jgi:hypothetical protein
VPAAISPLERKEADISSVRVARRRSAPSSILKSCGTFCNREQQLSFDTNDTKSIADDILAIQSAGMVARLHVRIDVSRKRTEVEYAALSGLGQAGAGSGRRGQSNPFDVTVPAAPVLHLS